MAYTYPPQWYEEPTGFSNTWIAAREWCWFLNGTHVSQTNTVPWAVIDCYDGVTREQPTNGDLSTLDAGNKWNPTNAVAPTQNMWVTFQAPASGNEDIVNRFQIYIRLAVFTACEFRFIFLDDWMIGAGSDSSPTVPATNELATIANHFADYKWLGLIDEGTAIMMAWSDASGQREWIYMGEVEPDNPISLNPRPYIMSMAHTAPGWRPAGGDYRTISAVDNTTIVNVGVQIEQLNSFDDSTDQDAFATRPMCSTHCYTTTSSHRYMLGKFRNLGAMGKFAGSQDDNIRDTAGYTGTDYRFEQWNRGNDNPRITHLNINEVQYTGHDDVSQISVPSTLIPSTVTPPTPSAPTVTFVSPQPNTTIRSNTAITIDVTDPDGFAGIQLRVQFNSSVGHATESIHGGDVLGEFEPFYQDCTIMAITNGFRFVLTRVNPDPKGADTGWPSSPTFIATAIDQAGTGT